MGDRDYKVVYRSRVLDKDEERPRIPTALDPYDTPRGLDSYRRRDRGARESASSFDDDSSATEVARSTTKSSYSVREDDRRRDNNTDRRRSTRAEAAPSDTSLRRSVVVDKKNDESPPRRPRPQTDSRISRDRGYDDVDTGRGQGRGVEYYVDDTPRDYNSPYVIDTRQGDIIDITFPGRERNQGYDRDGRSYTYDRDDDRKSYTRSSNDVRSSNVIVVGGDRNYARSQYDDDRLSRTQTRDHDRDEDWKLVDSMRDTRITSNKSRPSRSRAPTDASDSSYIMVSPTQTEPSKPREKSRARSAMRRSDYAETELRSRRSRSISFRDAEIEKHDASERRHERPGAEADICGPYLGRPVPEYDEQSDMSIAVRRSDYRSRDTEVDAFAATYSNRDDRSYRNDRSRREDTSRREELSRRDRDAATYRERDGPYAPQRAPSPEPKRERRAKSRRRRKEEEEDDASYYSENVIKKTTTRYR